MIEISGPRDCREHNAAEYLRDLIVTSWPDVRLGKRHNISIVVAAKCHGQPVVDIDLLLFADLGPRHGTVSPHASNQIVPLRGLCLAIEVKSHGPSAVRFHGNQVDVLYRERWENATENSHRQLHSVKNYIRGEGIPAPWVVNLIWLRGIPEEDLPPWGHNIVGCNSSWETFVQRIAFLQRPVADERTGSLSIAACKHSHCDCIERAAKLFTEEQLPTHLDRQKMERVTKTFLADQQYAEKLGQQLLIFRGRGGTGKTVRLLQLAYDLNQRQGERVLILTYNKALTSDLTRLLSLMRIQDSLSNRGVRVRTVHSFLRQIMVELRVLPTQCNDFLDNYEQYKLEALELIGAAEAGEIEQLRRHRDLSWDYLFVDEAQDWPSDERDLLFTIYDYRRFVLADGVDQLVRTHTPIDWREKISRRKTQIVSLRKVLRLKLGLCNFVKTFARYAGIDHQEIEPFPEVPGGRVIIVEGEYSGDHSLHEDLLKKNAEDGNEPVDMLFCVPPSLVVKKRPRHSVVASKFREWGYEVWDGTCSDTRGNYPKQLNELRIVQYDSCRGLEGWTVVLFQLDKFFDYKFNEYQPTPEETANLFFDRNSSAREFPRRWLMIPLTRAMDTLVIQVSSNDHVLTRSLREAAEECSDTVEWRSLAPR